MFISQAKCQAGWSQSIVLESYVYILGPMSGGKVQEYSFRSLVYLVGPMSGGKSQSIKVGFYISRALCQLGGSQSMYIFWVLCQVGRSKSIVLGLMSGASSKSIVLGSYVYIYDPITVGKVSDNSTGFLCIYPGPCVSLEGPRI